MNRIWKILILWLALSIIMQTASALTENQDYTCVDKGVTKSPPAKPSFVSSSNTEKTPLCSAGKVPKAIIRDTQTTDTIPDINITGQDTAYCNYGDGRCYDWASSTQSVYNKGIFAYITQHNPAIDPTYGYRSVGQMYVNGPSNNRILFGWIKEINNIPRISVSYWRYGTTLCFTPGCDMVQLSDYYYPGMPIYTNDNGVAYEIYYYNGDWWLWYDDDWMGYYPGSLWYDQFTYGSDIAYRGVVVSNIPITTTDMGNGRWASDPYAAKMFSQQYVDSYGWHNANTIKYTTSPNLYSVLATSYNSMRYGGPGSTGASITVVVPNGGENWPRGTTKTISWSSSGSPGSNVKIELLKGGVLNSVISSITPNDGSYSWYIPAFQPTGSDYKIRITSTTNSAYSDISNNNFIISGPPSITVVSPNGNENWPRGTTKTISWSSSGNVGANVKVELLKGGILNSVISSYTPNDGSYSWYIPAFQPIGSDYKIKVTSTTNAAYTDLSNNNFIISSSTPSIVVNSPNGGENWRRGTTHTISWSSSGNVGTNVKIELLKGGVLNSVISSYTTNDGSYSWYIPAFQPTGSDYKIRITSTSNSLYKDTSNNNFIISI